ncbi:MAG: Bax inhibitor-1 family protein [Myxococcota bacterium]
MRNVMTPAAGYGRPEVADSVESRLAFLKKVYGLLTLTVLMAMGGAFASLYLGAESSQLAVTTAQGSQIAVPPLVAFFARHWIIGGLLFLGSVFGASFVRHKPGINIVALFGMGVMAGLIAAPMVFMAQLAATNGTSLTLHPVRDAFLLALSGFTGLTVYALVSKKDFSFLRGFLSIGIWVIIGAMILGFFVQSSVFSLAVASGGVLLFGGFILYDTSRLLRSPEERLDPVGATISLFLNFLNLFLFLLRIFSGNRN